VGGPVHRLREAQSLADLRRSRDHGLWPAAAAGVQIAHPDALVIDVAGEASILMNIQEMSTVIQHRLPVKIFILNNQYMGMVRQ
jgi:thiamine pyrophosphate-dependent acetolactate synthase large subunit-like protein